MWCSWICACPKWTGLSGDEELATQARALLDQGVADYPEFSLFTRAQQYSLHPVDSPEFQSALDDMWLSVELFTGRAVERKASEIGDLVSAVALGQAAPACANTSLAPHNTEGFLLFFADLLVRAGDTEMAAVVLEQLESTEDFATWPYAELAGQRIRENGARAALFLNDDPTDDPRIIVEEPYNCGYCHAKN